MVIGILIGIFLTIIGLLILIGEVRTFYIQQSPQNQEFVKGTLPKNLSGLYKGSVNLKTTWQGKKFSSTNSGINIFKDEKGTTENFPFKTYSGQGLQDNIQVLKIDYSINKSPWWLRFILDELVETSPGKYLGKVHITLIPGLPFTVGFFKLEK